MNIEEAIKTAIEYEKKVAVVYREARDNAKDPVGQRIFRVLSEEETGHVEFLKHKLDEWKKTGTVKAERIETAIPSKEKIAEGVKKLKQHVSDQGQGLDLDLLRKALEVEIEAGNFYKRMVEELPEAGQQLFSPFLAIEEGHRTIVQAEIDSVAGTGFWFDMQEFDLEAG